MSGDKKAVANSFVQTGTKPPENQPLGCPRCQSSNTKFCYYNNYNLSQPRHFCKSCRRYWTHGGTLRNIPVGGGTRKSSAVKRSRPTVLSSTLTIHDPIPGSNPEMGHQVSNLNLNQAAVVEEAVVGFSGEFGSGSGICGLGFELCPWDWTVGEGVGGASCFNTWQVESGLGDGDCYGSWSDLSISTPGNGVK